MYSDILVAMDGGKTASHALDAALAIARETHAVLHAVHVIEIPAYAFEIPDFEPTLAARAARRSGERILEGARARMAQFGIAGATRLVSTGSLCDDVAKRLLSTAQQLRADLIVIGTQGRHGLARLMLGSIAERVLRGAACPVLVMPAHGGAPAPLGASGPASAGA
ncbi:universal stress protein [Burkholderia glumae]|uniref:Universal stress protein n=2 Tax=Burkholderia glumae TaxID=337 RepID=A0AAP9XVD9_BURGL|nr:universal stress protein [Burkholderia glumae]ACR32351.1 Universal stress protein family [Burkholderia glumae BGR1]AJY64840.1 universal stress family protein [Burkholderia glumae LMG 2196 = ATCC 33617]KHJ63204.1 universal stress protein UspA [Burkholderia glumae]MCM2484452.1 universal stress protein [Burkholderia glumae]MCM2494821.1 universal stress protein [Burkholderia glumae]